MTTLTGAIAAPHRLATEAGQQAYRDGGNAVDAAIAAAAVLTVVYPHNVTLGGDLIALVRTPDGELVCVNASGWIGADADAAALRARHGAALPTRGADTVTVPGGVRGWAALRGLGARLAWSQTLAPASDIAHAPVPMSQSLATHLHDSENSDLIGTPTFDSVFCPNGTPLREGQEFRQPALAVTFDALVERGPDEFYTGEVAQKIVSYLRSQGSSLTEADFAEFEPELCAPLSMAFGDLTVNTSPPNSAGFLLLRTLRAIERFGLTDPLGGDLGALLQIFKSGNDIRALKLADPRCAAVDIDELLDPATVAPGSPLQPAARGDTVGIAAADSDGYAVSLIQSVYFAFGSGLLDPDTGILFQNRGAGFSLDPDSPNVIAPRKRPAHTLIPVITTRENRVEQVLATMGGQGQPQILTQVLLNLTTGAGAQRAVSAPRAIVGAQSAGATPETVTYESDLPASLQDSGLHLTEVPPHDETLGQSNVVVLHSDTTMTAAADPRADGAAIVVHYPRHS